MATPQVIKTQQTEKARLIQKMLESKSKGGRMQRPMGDAPRLYNCETLENYSAESGRSAAGAFE